MSLAKQINEVSRSQGVRITDADLVIQAALMAAEDKRTAQRLVDELLISAEAAAGYASLLYQAAELVAAKYGREQVFVVHREVSNRRLSELGGSDPDAAS